MTDERASRGARIRELRESKGLSRPQLADALGLSRESGQVKQWEAGARLSADNLAALARYFGVTEEYILGLAPREADADALFLSRRDAAVSQAFARIIDRINDQTDALRGSSGEEESAPTLVSIQAQLHALTDLVAGLVAEVAALAESVAGGQGEQRSSSRSPRSSG